MATIATVLIWNLALVVGVFLVLWLVSLRLRDASIVDPCWGMGFVLVAWHTFLMRTPPGPRGWLLIGLVTLWGVRLSGYLLWRNWGHGEDRRYQAMREKHGAKFWLVSLFTVFLLQAVLLWFISWPVQMGIVFGQQLKLLDYVGAILCLTGIVFESVGDWQLARFKASPQNAGRVLDTGLWRYTRHPNYFGDFCVWWGIYLIATSGGAWWTVFSPLVMSFFLMKVSGVTLLESTIVERRPEYRDYIQQTNAFFPGPPKR
jgi:steroid 5-alpha reductase family enzyme